MRLRCRGILRKERLSVTEWLRIRKRVVTNQGMTRTLEVCCPGAEVVAQVSTAPTYIALYPPLKNHTLLHIA